jgi:hypothetical protein
MVNFDDILAAAEAELGITSESPAAGAGASKNNGTPVPMSAAGGNPVYAEAAVVRELAELRAAPERNNQLNKSAFNLGQLVGGGELPEGGVAEALIQTARDIGLEEREIANTVRSGLEAGKKKPRQAPPPKLSAPPVTVVEPGISAPAAVPDQVEPITLEQAHEVFRGWLGDDYDLDALDALLCAFAAERLDGDPLWMLLISGPGNAKTETIQAATGIGAHIVSTVSGEAAFLSATPRRDRAKNATGGLLRQIGSRGMLVIKDVTSILSMNRDTRAGVLAALREIHDGHWSRDVGVDRGQRLSWAGRLVIIGACTTAWDQAHAAIAAMGDRFVLLRMDSTKGRITAGRKSIGNTGAETQMRAELATAVAGVIAGRDPELDLSLTDDETDRLLAAANLVTLARTGVEYDYRGDVIDAHAPEMPTRFGKQLAQIVRGGLSLGMTRHRALNLALRCARDSLPPLRLAIIHDIAANPHSATRDVRRRLNKPRATVDRQLQALHMLGLLDCEEYEEFHRGQPVAIWRYQLADGIDPNALNSVPEMSPHAPRHQGNKG